MGNKQSCCITASPKTHRKNVEEIYAPEEPNEAPPQKLPSSTNLQHISEREPDGEFRSDRCWNMIDSCEQADITCQRRPIHYHANIILSCLSSMYTHVVFIRSGSYVSWRENTVLLWLSSILTEFSFFITAKNNNNIDVISKYTILVFHVQRGGCNVHSVRHV